MKKCHNYQTETGTTYGGQGIPIDIGKSNKNFKESQNALIVRHTDIQQEIARS